MQKTLAMRFLEGKHILYETLEYPDELRDAVAIAERFGAPASQVFKTLVVPSPKSAPRSIKHMLVMVPADRQLDLKKLARAVGIKKLKMATHAEAEKLTGLKVGGISALALSNRGFAVYLDISSQSQERIYVSAGQRGLNVKLSVKDLQAVTKARLVDVCS
jgi:Cys-tRNA(Pro)/Cys-tRNA(Cys) deacylase